MKLLKCYDGKYRSESGCSETQAIKNFVGLQQLPTAAGPGYATIENFDALGQKLAADVAKCADVAEDLKALHERTSSA